MKIKERELDRMIGLVEETIGNLEEIDQMTQDTLASLDDLLTLLEEIR